MDGVEVLRAWRRAGREVATPVVFTSLLGLPTSSQETRRHGKHGWGNLSFELTQTPQVWLDHIIREEGAELEYIWDVIEGLFPEGMIEEMMAAYTARITSLARDSGGVGCALADAPGRRATIAHRGRQRHSACRVTADLARALRGSGAGAARSAGGDHQGADAKVWRARRDGAAARASPAPARGEAEYARRHCDGQGLGASGRGVGDSVLRGGVLADRRRPSSSPPPVASGAKRSEPCADSALGGAGRARYTSALGGR